MQFDLWEVDPMERSSRYDWTALKERVKKDGLRNSLLMAPMPTASTSQILENNECHYVWSQILSKSFKKLRKLA